MATTLDCRLLCASVCAYGIQADGTIAAQQPYSDAAAFAAPPAAFVGGADAINACLVGTTGDGVVVAFRGTLAPAKSDLDQSVLDWINDFEADLTEASGMPGRVHQGFWNSLETLWDGLSKEVARLLAAGSSGTRVFVTGHSKGGSLADLAAMRLLAESGVQATVYTYAAAHPADAAFAAGYNGRIESTRYEYADDIVPHVPPSLAFRPFLVAGPLSRLARGGLDVNYAPVGTLRYIQRDGTIVGDSPSLERQRFASLVETAAKGGLARIAADHDSRCGGGYMSAVCPAGVCP
jgi:hypothetical protein